MTNSRTVLQCALRALWTVVESNAVLLCSVLGTGCVGMEPVAGCY